MDELVELATVRRLAAAYAALMDGLWYPGSEGDTAYQAFHAPLSPGADLSPETFQVATGLDDAWSIQLTEGSAWFESQIASAGDPDAGADADARVAYEQLQRAMSATLTAPLHAGVAFPPENGEFQETRRYIFGRFDGGGLAGLVAHSIET
jgi:hypothetical protein